MSEREVYTHGPAFDAFLTRRTAAREGAFFHPHLRAGMRLLDCGCGPGSITLGLAAQQGVANVTFEVASVYALPFPEAAFDAAFAKFSPGALLVDKVSDELLASVIAQIESCSSDGGFMENLWTGRRTTVDLLVDVGAEKSVGFAAIALAERGHAWARGMRNRLRLWNTQPRTKTAAATNS